MTIRFYLADERKKTTSIVLEARQGRNTKNLVKFGTGETINTAYWNKETHRIKKNVADSSTINSKLNALETLVKNSYDEAERILKVNPFDHIKAKLQEWKTTNNPTAKAKAKEELAKAEFEQRQAEEEERRKNDLLLIVESFLTLRKGELTAASLEKYSQLLKDLRSIFGNSFPVHKLADIQQLDMLKDFWLHERGMANNTIARKYKFLRTVLLWARKRGHTIPQAAFDLESPVSVNDADVIALSDNELSRIEALTNLPKYLENARTCFLALCYTGCRHSDLNQVTAQNVQDGLLRIRQLKTDHEVKIPIHKRLERLLQKPMHIISTVNLSEYAKELGKLAEIDTEITVRKRYGEKIERITKPKYEFISSHTGRRTFITFMLSKGLPHQAVMKLSGHKDIKSFQKYVNFSQDILSTAVVNMWGE